MNKEENVFKIYAKSKGVDWVETCQDFDCPHIHEVDEEGFCHGWGNYPTIVDNIIEALNSLKEQ